MYQLFFGVATLLATTLGIVAVDKKIRSSRSDWAFSANEPSWSGIVALAILFNVMALPYHFGKSRGRAVWGGLGFLMFVGCFIAMLVASGVGAALDQKVMRDRIMSATGGDTGARSGERAASAARPHAAATRKARPKPACCASPLVVSLKGYRWSPRSGFVTRGSLHPGATDFLLTDKELPSELGCMGAAVPTFGHDLYWSAPVGQHRIALDVSRPMLFSGAVGPGGPDMDSDHEEWKRWASEPHEQQNLNTNDGTVVLTDVGPEVARGTMNAEFDDDTWAVGTFEMTVCK